MIVSRIPIRICPVGGGTDLPDFYQSTFGAGGGGFLLVFAPPERTRAVRQAMASYRELPVRLTRTGTEILVDDQSRRHKATT